MMTRKCMGLKFRPCGEIMGYTDGPETGETTGLCRYCFLQMRVEQGHPTPAEITEYYGMKEERRACLGIHGIDCQCQSCFLLKEKIENEIYEGGYDDAR